ncbi:hypothetical protein HOA92_03075 [archaeon]|nr:hypothetical protein [archaeon]MBT6761998.1 hypothetical protein [archaeon]
MGLESYASDYSGIGQQLQHILASSTFYWLITIAIVFFIGAVLIGGFKEVATRNRLKWVLLHTLSLFLVGYFLLPLNFNRFLNVGLFAFFVTIFSYGYRYLLMNVTSSWKIMCQWFLINLFTLLIVQILYDVLGVTDNLLRLIFAAFCLTLVGVYVHSQHKGPNPKNNSLSLTRRHKKNKGNVRAQRRRYARKRR